MMREMQIIAATNVMSLQIYHRNVRNQVKGQNPETGNHGKSQRKKLYDLLCRDTWKCKKRPFV
jgi:hypothetical protein